jgi:hypothetical protein
MATPTTLPASFTAGQVLTAAQMNDLRGAFRVLQVVSTFKSDTFTTSSTSFTDVTGLSVSITPQSATSKILVFAQVNGSEDFQVAAGFMQLVRDSTSIDIGDAAGSRRRVSAQFNNAFGSNLNINTLVFLDSPATTSATTYKIQVLTNSGTVYVNRTKSDSDNTAHSRGASTITVMEISA